MKIKLPLFVIFILVILLVACAPQEPVTPDLKPGDSKHIPTKEFTMRAFQFDFDPATITVNKGDRVKLTITSEDVPHGFAIREYGISKRLTPGIPVTFEFIADKAGTFTYFCSVPCGRGHGGMRGTLVVQE